MKTKFIYIFLSFIFLGFTLFKFNKQSTNIPIIAIANYGPHSSLEDSIKGIKEELTNQGYIEGENIAYEIADVNFDTSLIPQMITNLKAKNPNVMITLATPVAQFAKHYIKNIPLIFNVVTDPVEAGLLKDGTKADGKTTCISDKQNLDLLLNFVKKIIPTAKRIGILYSTSEANDIALIRMMESAAKKNNMQVLSIAIDQSRDIPLRIQQFKDQVDFIYVGTSGAIQPALPSIIAEADKMMIPVFNANEEAVYNNQALASFGVNYIQIGRSTGDMVAKILKSSQVTPPYYPEEKDHNGFISKKKAKFFGIEIPSNLSNTIIVE